MSMNHMPDWVDITPVPPPPPPPIPLPKFRAPAADQNWCYFHSVAGGTNYWLFFSATDHPDWAGIVAKTAAANGTIKQIVIDSETVQFHYHSYEKDIADIHEHQLVKDIKLN